MTLNILLVLIGSLLILLFYLWWLRSEGQKQQERTEQAERITFNRIMQASIHSGQRAKNHNLPPRAAGLDHKRVS